MHTNATLPGQRIRAAAAKAERSLRWVADKAGIPLSTFNRKLKGHSEFTLSELFRIAKALGVRPYTLLPDEFSAEAMEPVAA